ncbi:MAG: hypothetical protein ACTS8S_02565 [Giesbergeria sp.]
MFTTINCSIEGTSPLLLNNFTDEAQMAASNGTRASTVGSKGTPREQAERKLYKSNDGGFIMPQPNLFRCVIDAGKYFKAGKSKVTTMQSSLIPACLDIEGVEIPIIAKEPWEVDTRAVRIPSTGGRILAHRPKFNNWRLTFTMRLDDSVMSPELLREIIDAAGSRIGLGDFRPDRKGPFGKFVVVMWDREDNDPKKGKK